MSQENVDLVLRGNAAANSGDYAAAAELWHPDAKLRDLAHAVDTTQTVNGRDAVLALWSQWRETFAEFRAEIEETVDCGTQIVCATRWVGRGSASGVTVDVSQVDVYEVQDGKIVRATLVHWPSFRSACRDAAASTRRATAPRTPSGRFVPLRLQRTPR